MQQRGVRVDPERWGSAVEARREGGIAATLEAEDPAQAEAALHRLITLDSYAEAVQAQAALDPRQRVRATWYPGGTWSGRITARQPPLQSITKQGALRAAVVPAPGCSFVVGDWSQSQLRIAFGLSGDPAGPTVCAPGHDLHAQIGEAVAPGRPEARSLGKLLNFAILYLAGVDTLIAGAAERGIDLSRTTARGLIRRLELAYPVLCAWRRGQAGLVDLPVAWEGELRRTVPLPSSAFDATGTPSLPKILAGIMQAHEVEALRFVLDHTEQRLGALGYRPVLLVHDEVVWEGPTGSAEEAREAAHSLMVEALAGVTRGIPALATVEVRSSWAANG
jgi:DNA polymerase I-like protein with 3'-5' exonuclease and polymerase domains